MPRARLLWSLVVVGAVCALMALAPRLRLERETRSVDILVDYYALQEFCQSEGLDPTDTLHRLQKAGTTALAFSELTLDRLTASGQMAVYGGADFARLLRAKEAGLPKTTERPNPDRTYLVVYDAGVRRDLETFLPVLLGPDRVRAWPRAAVSLTPSDTQPVVLEVSTSLKALSASGMGFSRDDVRQAQKAGLNVYLRPQNRPRFQDADVTAYVDAMNTLGTVRGVIFEGPSNEVVGFPDSLEATEKALRKSGLLFGNIEVPTVDAAQKGSVTLGRKLDDRTVRVFSIVSQQQAKMTPGDAIDRQMLGARERNMRVLYLRFFAAPQDGATLLQTNLDYVSALRDELAKAGFTFDGARPFPDMAPRPWWLVGMTLGAAAAGVLFLELFTIVPGWLIWAVLGGTPVLAAISVVVHKGALLSTGMALEAALVFSVLGLAFGLPMLRAESESAPTAGRAMIAAILPLALVTSVSLLGGLYMAAFMADTRFMLSVNQFRGIKLIMVLAPAVVVLYYVTRVSPHRETLRSLLERRVVFWHVAAFALLAAAAAFYVVRTGNASPAAASDYERVVRSFLENALVVRPRFKEFAFGHPAWFVMAVLLWKQRGRAWMWLLTLCVAIGQVDVVDTFAHAHTPYLISLVRALIGLALGIPLGLAAGAVVSRFVSEGIPQEAGGIPHETAFPTAPIGADDAPHAGVPPPSGHKS